MPRVRQGDRRVTPPKNNAEWLDLFNQQLELFLNLYDKQKMAGDTMAYDITWGRIVMLEELIDMLAPKDQA